MSKYDVITRNIRFSYSSLSSFNTCRFAWKLKYIDRIQPRESNFFAEYGTLVHDTMEQFFSKKLSAFELSQFFKDNYYLKVTTPPPAFSTGIVESYLADAIEFFDNFQLDTDKYDIINVEGRIDGEIEGVLFTGRPDLVLKDKENKDVMLVDYKTAKPFYVTKAGVEQVDHVKMDNYLRQMYIYTYLLKNNEPAFADINKIVLWFTRSNRKYTFDWNEKEEQKAIEWVKKTAQSIWKEESFRADLTNEYFCNNLCDVRMHCPYRAM